MNFVRVELPPRPNFESSITPIPLGTRGKKIFWNIRAIIETRLEIVQIQFQSIKETFKENWKTIDFPPVAEIISRLKKLFSLEVQRFFSYLSNLEKFWNRESREKQEVLRFSSPIFVNE